MKTAKNGLFKKLWAIFGKSELLVYFWNQKFDKKIQHHPQKVQKYKNYIKTAKNPLFTKLWAIFEKIGFNRAFLKPNSWPKIAILALES